MLFDRPARSPAYAPWRPLATYTLLGIIVAVFVIQLVLISAGQDALHNTLFVVDMHWPFEPWTLITATLAHGGFAHLALNGLVLYFFGPLLERLVGRRNYLLLFFAAGAVASILQVYLQWALFGQDNGGLGASGALMMVFGALMVLMPHEKILIWGILPMPFWMAGVGFALLDVLGALNPYSGVGNFAHLSGLAIGLYVGWRLRENLRRRGLRLVPGSSGY